MINKENKKLTVNIQIQIQKEKNIIKREGPEIKITNIEQEIQAKIIKEILHMQEVHIHALIVIKQDTINFIVQLKFSLTHLK